MTAITVTGEYTINPGQSVNLSVPNGAAYSLQDLGSPPDFEDEGTVAISTTQTYGGGLDGLISSDTDFSFTNKITVAQNASFSVTDNAPNSGVYGYVGEQTTTVFENDGYFTVLGNGVTYGVALSGDGNNFTNTGTIDVEGGLAIAVAAIAATSSTPNAYVNSGTIRVSGFGSTESSDYTDVSDFAIDVTAGGSLTNSGALTSTGTAILLSATYSPSVVFTINNSGVITAPTAISSENEGGAAPAQSAQVDLINTGTINGLIDFGFGPPLQDRDDSGSQVDNRGTINGAVLFDTNGDDVYQGALGKLTGGVYLGTGTDSVTLGNDGEIVRTGQGVANITLGDGADTVTVVVDSSTIDITGFSAAQGDRVDLAPLHEFSSLSQLEARASQVGAATVIYLQAGVVRLENIDLTSLTAADFEFTHSSSDFTGSGDSDIVWQNTAGQVAYWGVTGSTVTGASVSTVAPGWQLQDTGDFDGDGRSGDLLYRNPTTGQIAIWDMKGATIASAAVVATIPTEWRVEGTGDFNGDGKSDIVLHDTLTGQVAIWEMNGTQIQAAAIMPTAPAGWNMVGIGDFDGDGKADILWQTAANQIAIWEMNGLSIQSTATVITMPSGWHVQGTGDFDGDGKSDIVLESDAGQVAVWEMDGSSIKAASVIAAPGAAWQVSGVGDLNGDGKADIVLHDAATGQNAAWDMNGLTIASAALLPAVDSSWTALNHHFDWV